MFYMYVRTCYPVKTAHYTAIFIKALHLPVLNKERE